MTTADSNYQKKKVFKTLTNSCISSYSLQNWFGNGKSQSVYREKHKVLLHAILFFTSSPKFSSLQN